MTVERTILGLQLRKMIDIFAIQVDIGIFSLDADKSLTHV
jgi:hypothetical protein